MNQRQGYGDSAVVDLIQVAGNTDVGRVRDNNEDNLLVVDLTTKVEPPLGRLCQFVLQERGVLLLVSDGMGGRNAGEVASRIVVETFRSEITKPDNKLSGCELLAEIAKKANLAVWTRAQKNPDEQGMGATLTAMLIQGDKAHIVQIGDSRAYVVRSETIFQLTKDQSMVQTLIDANIIRPEEAETHPYRHVILQSLGAEPTVYPVTSTIDLYDGDYLLLCSDGLSNMIKDQQLEELILAAPDIESGCKGLIDIANYHGGKDNITCILAVVEYGVPVERANSGFLQGGLVPEISTAARVEKVDTTFPALVRPSGPDVKMPEPEATRERILLIDGDPYRRESLEEVLRGYYELLTASDGEEGLAKAITENPRLIIAVTELPKITGIAMCQALKANERFRNVPVVLISNSHTDRSKVIESLSSGADECLVFPLDERELLLKLRSHVHKVRLLEKLRYEQAYLEAENQNLCNELEAAEKARQKIFQTIIDSSSDGILILDNAGWVTAVNATFEHFHKVKRDQIVGFGYRAVLKKIQRFYEQPEKQLMRFTELINNPKLTVEDEIRVWNDRGMSIRTKRYSAPILDDEGNTFGRYFIFRNLIF
ncbi:MAG: Stp1/IreP family PP2C-type Ser/Thr phosphatase [Acidobacteriota bacterium]|nr:Stp1/IreP family PP2C-type Ser/Thr phosphatase [Blastocatellia bacterium]MDW8411641.1 Stp1/IreP family PP2C-type Ser/Thr phosphatase [Acidobacteriota bacterium]